MVHAKTTSTVANAVCVCGAKPQMRMQTCRRERTCTASIDSDCLVYSLTGGCERIGLSEAEGGVDNFKKGNNHCEGHFRSNTRKPEISVHRGGHNAWRHGALKQNESPKSIAEAVVSN